MERLIEKSQWRNPHTAVISTVERLVNTEPNAPTPPLVVYVDSTGVRAAEFTQVFLDKNEPYDPEVGVPLAIEVMLPEYRVFFGGYPAELPHGICYMFDATYECSEEEATLEARRCIDEVFAQLQPSLAGVNSAPMVQTNTPTLKYVKRGVDTGPMLRDQYNDAGINYVGLVRGAPVVWGNRLTDSSSIPSWIILASALRYAYRRVTFMYNEAQALRHWAEHFQEAVLYLGGNLRFSRENEIFQVEVLPDRVVISLSNHWYAAERANMTPIVVQLPSPGNTGIKLPHNIALQLTAMYDMTKIVGGIA